MSEAKGSEGLANDQVGGGLGKDFASTDIMGSDMENISWSTLFQGIKVNTGVRFFIVFSTFISWLYVVYWIRHHEPFANQTIGVSTPRSRTAEADRSLIGRVIRVLPFKTSGIGHSAFYSPIPGGGKSQAEYSNLGQLTIYNKSFGTPGQERPYTGMVVIPRQKASGLLVWPSEQKFDERFGSPIHP